MGGRLRSLSLSGTKRRWNLQSGMKRIWRGGGPPPGLLEGLEVQNSGHIFQEKLEVSEDSARSSSPSKVSTERPEKSQRSKTQTRLMLSLHSELKTQVPQVCSLATDF